MGRLEGGKGVLTPRTGERVAIRITIRAGPCSAWQVDRNWPEPFTSKSGRGLFFRFEITI